MRAMTSAKLLDRNANDRNVITGPQDKRARDHGAIGEGAEEHVDPDLIPTIRVGLRIPYGLLLIAKSEWIDPDVPAGEADRYLPFCQQLLEDALLRRQPEADQRAKAWAAGTLPADEPRLPSVRQGDDDPRQLAVKLSARAHSIAHKLTLRYPKSETVPRICEPILCDELRDRGNAALDRLDRAVAAVTTAITPTSQAAPAGQPPGKT